MKKNDVENKFQKYAKSKSEMNENRSDDISTILSHKLCYVSI